LNINFVDNTTDLDKPISTVVQSALDGILVQIDSLLAGDLTLQGYIDGLTLGLASLSQQVSNNSTSQSSSISAIQSSLNTMNTAILALPTFANLPTKNSLGMDLVDNTPDTAKPISTAVQDALDAIQVLLDDVNANLSSFIGPSDLVPYSTTSQMQSYVQTQISSMQDSSEVAASIASALVGYEDTAEVTTAILAAIAPLASSVFVNDSIASAIAPYALTSEMETYVPPLISSAISDLDASLSLAISNASDASASQLDSREIAIQSEVDSKLLDYVLSSSLSSSLSTALSSYATSASVASALAPYSTTDSVSSSITSALIPYALISSVNPAIQTALATYWNSAQVNSAINTALTDYVVAEDISDMISSALSTYDSSVASAISTALVSYSTTTSMNQAISSAIAASEGGAFGSSQAQALINTSLSSYYTQAQTDTLLGLEANVAYVDSQIATVTTSVTGLQSSKANVDNPTFTTKVTTPSLQVTGGTLGANRVLTSDASGNATWQTPSAGSSSLTYVFTKNSTQTNITSPNFNTAMTFVLPSAGTWQISYTGRVTLLSQSAPKLGYIAAICTGAPTGWDSATVVSPLSAGSTQTAVTMELNMPVTINFIYVASAAITMYVRYQNVGSSSDIYFGRAAGGDSYGGCVTAVKIA
jgi:hypothetical protein